MKVYIGEPCGYPRTKKLCNNVKNSKSFNGIAKYLRITGVVNKDGDATKLIRKYCREQLNFNETLKGCSKEIQNDFNKFIKYIKLEKKIMKVYFSKTNGTSHQDRMIAKMAIENYLEGQKAEIVEYIPGDKYDINLTRSCDEVYVLSHNGLFVGRGVHGEIISFIMREKKCHFITIANDRTKVSIFNIIKIEEHDTKDWKEKYGLITAKADEVSVMNIDPSDSKEPKTTATIYGVMV